MQQIQTTSKSDILFYFILFIFFFLNQTFYWNFFLEVFSSSQNKKPTRLGSKSVF